MFYSPEKGAPIVILLGLNLSIVWCSWFITKKGGNVYIHHIFLIYKYNIVIHNSQYRRLPVQIHPRLTTGVSTKVNPEKVFNI